AQRLPVVDAVAVVGWAKATCVGAASRSEAFVNQASIKRKPAPAHLGCTRSDGSNWSAQSTPGNPRSGPAPSCHPSTRQLRNGSVMDEVYDLVVLGAGPAGDVAAQLAASFGRRVLIVERDR